MGLRNPAYLLYFFNPQSRSIVLHSIPMEFEPCARDEHQWFEGDSTDAPDWTPAWGMAGQIHVCDRCTSVRLRCINGLGRVESRLTRYIYPDGYSMSKDERPSKQELRVEWFKKQTKLGYVDKDPKRKPKPKRKPAKKAAAKKATPAKKGARRGHLQSVG